MLNALSTALFAITLRLASETGASPEGLLGLARNRRLAPALTPVAAAAVVCCKRD